MDTLVKDVQDEVANRIVAGELELPAGWTLADVKTWLEYNPSRKRKRDTSAPEVEIPPWATKLGKQFNNFADAFSQG